MKYYLIAGEPSGDLHGANLIRGLRKADPGAELRFWGGDRMAAAAAGCGTLVKHYRETSFFGFANVLRHLRTIRRQIAECRRDIRAWHPDAVIPIDYPGFNLRIARDAHEAGLRVHYYIAPKVWAWKEWRVKQLRRYVDRLHIIFPFERDYFRRFGIEPCFAGNPLADAIEERRPTLPTGEAFRAAHGLDDRPIVALLAGSRATEIRVNLRPMVEAARRIPDRQFVVAGVSWLDRRLYATILRDTPVRIVEDATYELLHVAEAAIVTSGTATLETALMGIPEVVLYRIPWLYEKLRPLVLRIPFVSLVNINLGREAVRELVTSAPTPELLERELRPLLEGGAERRRMLADFDELRALIGPAGASDRAARRMVEELRGETPGETRDKTRDEFAGKFPGKFPSESPGEPRSGAAAAGSHETAAKGSGEPAAK